jgi:hypothetical protein
MNKNQINYSLSNFDIDKYLNKKSNIILYKDLKKYKSIDDALGHDGYFILLYETRERYGHWTIIIKLDDNTIEHFDSYGLKPDDELNYIKPLFKIINNIIPYLSWLFINSKYKIEYNNYQLQSMQKGINTCGRHILMRLKYRKYNIDQYKKFLDRLLKKYNIDNYDLLVTKLIKL